MCALQIIHGMIKVFWASFCISPKYPPRKHASLVVHLSCSLQEREHKNAREQISFHFSRMVASLVTNRADGGRRFVSPLEFVDFVRHSLPKEAATPSPAQPGTSPTCEDTDSLEDTGSRCGRTHAMHWLPPCSPQCTERSRQATRNSLQPRSLLRRI